MYDSITNGPAEFVVVSFPEDRLPEPVREAIFALAGSEAVRLLDVAVVRRGLDGSTTLIELQDLGDEIEIEALSLPSAGLFSDEDAAEVTTDLEPGTTGLIMLIEHVWARDLTRAARAAGAKVLAAELVPAPAVEEVLAALTRA